MGYVFDFNDARLCEQWFRDERNLEIARLEYRLMFDMLSPLSRKTILDIGCGAGATLEYLLGKGLQVTGLEPSPYMLDLAARRLGHHADLHRGVAEELPFDDNSFNYSCILTSLEFVDDPERALEEACRVTRDKLFIGILNRFAVNGVKVRIRRMFSQNIYSHAHLFTLWEIKKILCKLLGEVPIEWKSIPLFPPCSGSLGRKLVESSLARKSPFGPFMGIMVTLTPRFRTRPLELKVCAKRGTEVVPG